MALLIAPHPSLLLIRHGETEWNRQGWYQGQSDPPLSSQGQAQALTLARHLENSKATALISSPLGRAQETAKAIANALALTPTIDSRLAEISFGDWEGLPQTEIKRRWPMLLRRWKQAPDTVIFPNGESLPALHQRVQQFLESIASQTQWLPGPVLAVTHNAVIRVALLEAMDAPLSRFRSLHVDNAAVIALNWRDGRYHIESEPSTTNTGYDCGLAS